MNKTLKSLAMVLMVLSLAVIYPTIGYSKPGGGGGKPPKGGGGETAPKNAFNIMMNYELGMHCTGFEFSYCCVLPPYNSILAQVVKTEKVANKPVLLEADPNVGLDGLGRPTVVRDGFNKYVLKYKHEAQPRPDIIDPLISFVEGNSLLMWNTLFDAAVTDGNGALVYGDYDAGGFSGVLQGDGDTADANDDYWNAIWNHLYIYADLEGSNPNNSSLEADKIRLGIHVVYPDNTGAALQPMGPGVPGAGFDNVLTFSGEHGTIVFTQMKVLENLPVMLTSPRIWEALGLPLTPFEDTINFFGDPGSVDESKIRPYVKMIAEMYHYDPATGGAGAAVLDDGVPVTGFGTAPIDIPNCERCHALGDGDSVNSAQNGRPAVAALVQGEMEFWNTYYGIGAGDSDWYSRLKGAAISILQIHDDDHGTSFMANYPAAGDQITRLGHETVICQRCHADNVIAVVKSASGPGGSLIPPLTEAIHYNHKDNAFSDSLGRNGGCQGCHPAHRSDGSLDGYPITELGLNAYADGDNRDAAGGCYVGRDVHSNRNKDTDGAETPNHLNAVGQWLVDNVVADTGEWKGIWCTNCHTQLGQELWKAENVADLINAQPGDPGHVREPSPNATLRDVALAAGLDGNSICAGSPDPAQCAEDLAIAWLDPKTNDDTAAIWAPDPGLCDHVATLFGAPANPAQDANVATIEVNLQANPIVPTDCSTGVGLPGPDCDGDGNPDFSICGSLDGDGDVSVNILDFCTTPDCVAVAQGTLTGPGQAAVPVPFSAATDGRDHWLSPGNSHCADCHAAPYTEQSGNISAYPPFNYPRKASLFRYTRGHQDITCQGCHESIHGLYPSTMIDTTTYAQAASMNTDGSHGPLKCGACHVANDNGVNKAVANLTYQGSPIGQDFDKAVSWMHAYTDEADPRDSVCLRCHGDNSADILSGNGKWNSHAKQGRVSRATMDKVEIAQNGHVNGDPAFEDPLTTVCTSCHGDRTNRLASRGCTNKWKKHLLEGRVSASVWEYVSSTVAGTTCGY